MPGFTKFTGGYFVANFYTENFLWKSHRVLSLVHGRTTTRGGQPENPPPKFSKTHLVVKCNIKLQSFASPRNYCGPAWDITLSVVTQDPRPQVRIRKKTNLNAEIVTGFEIPRFVTT